MITIQIDGIERLQRQLASVPLALRAGLARGINRTARAIEQHALIGLEQSIDRPTPFTMSALRVLEARPRPDPSAIIYVQPLQARYLRFAVLGGMLPTILTPINIKLNAFGNIVGKRGGLDAIAAKGARRFVATINGTTGVWERRGRNGRQLKLLVQVRRQQERKPRWDFYGIGKRVAAERLPRDVAEAIRAELSR